MPATMSFLSASTGFFELTMYCSRISRAWSLTSEQDDFVRRLSRGASQAHVRARSRSHLCGSASFLSSPFCGDSLWLGQPCGGNASGLRSGVLASRPRPALSCIHDTSASDLAEAAFSALPVGSMPAISSTRANTAPTTGNTPPRLCALTLEGTTSLASTFSG